MDTVTLLVIVVIVVVVVAALAVAASAYVRKRRSERLREEFGPEYERTMRSTDDPREAEADLRRREKQRAKLELRDLDPREREQYRERWDSVQREFVDDPGRAVQQADRLVVDVMSARGYPADDVDRRAEDLSVDFPVITQRYREAREISRANEAGRADTEDLRGAVTSYRSLVHALLDDTDDRHDGRAGDRRDPGGDSGRSGAAALDPRDGDRNRVDDRGRGADLDRGRGADDLDRGRGSDARRDLDRDGDRRLDGDRHLAEDRRDDRHLNDRHPDDRRVGDGHLGDGHLDSRRDGRGDGRDRLDGHDGDDGDDRRLRDKVRDVVTPDRDGDGRGRDADRRLEDDRHPDDRHLDDRVDDGRSQPWERGRHARNRTDDDPRRGAAT